MDRGSGGEFEEICERRVNRVERAGGINNCLRAKPHKRVEVVEHGISDNSGPEQTVKIKRPRNSLPGDGPQIPLRRTRRERVVQGLRPEWHTAPRGHVHDWFCP